MRKSLVFLAAGLVVACGDSTPVTPTTQVGTTANGIPVRSFCDPDHPTRVYYMTYDDSGGSHMALAAIADPSCQK
jgi:hypothetical protein